MDKLSEQLRADAGRIDVQVSAELDRRIRASLRGVAPERAEQKAVQQRPAIFWWASSLTGIAAALVIIAVINSNRQSEVPPETIAAISPLPAVPVRMIDWRAESAMLTSPLRQELEDLQSDIRKVEHKVKQDVGL